MNNGCVDSEAPSGAILASGLGRPFLIDNGQCRRVAAPAALQRTQPRTVVTLPGLDVRAELEGHLWLCDVE